MESTIVIMFTGASLGLLHAFDADHVAAVSGLAERRGGSRSGPVYALRWALGHGGALLAVGVLTMWLGMRLPDPVFVWAEKAVGVVLIGIGVSVLWSLRRGGILLRRHDHGRVEHIHLAGDEGDGGAHDHAPVLVGLLHGLAGSAPALAMIPAARSGPAVGLVYLLVFSLGVALGMLFVGLLLGRLQSVLARSRAGIHEIGQALIGIAAASIGVVWLVG